MDGASQGGAGVFAGGEQLGAEAGEQREHQAEATNPGTGCRLGSRGQDRGGPSLGGPKLAPARISNRQVSCRQVAGKMPAAT